MVRGTLRRELKHIGESLPPPPPCYSELPIEVWVDERMQSALDTVLVENSSHEEFFYKWLEELPRRLGNAISLKVLEARGERWTVYDPIPPLPEEVAKRVVETVPPWIEYHHQRWIKGFPHREARRRWVKEVEAIYPGDGRGRGWKVEVEKEYAELKVKYDGWEEQWANDYREWKAERALHGASQRHLPIR